MKPIFFALMLSAASAAAQQAPSAAPGADPASVHDESVALATIQEAYRGARVAGVAEMARGADQSIREFARHVLRENEDLGLSFESYLRDSAGNPDDGRPVLLSPESEKVAESMATMDPRQADRAYLRYASEFNANLVKRYDLLVPKLRDAKLADLLRSLREKADKNRSMAESLLSGLGG
jgi:predicted outer membrane protein